MYGEHIETEETTVDVLRTVALLLATLSTGLMAGVFGLYTHTVMPGLARTDDRTFVGAFQALDRAILNPWFLGGGFLGALVTTAVATVSAVGTATLPWVTAALVLYLVTFVVTIAVHLPLNDALKEAGDPDDVSDLATVRRQFDEERWRRWNVVRTWASTAAFALLCWALVLHDHAG